MGNPCSPLNSQGDWVAINKVYGFLMFPAIVLQSIRVTRTFSSSFRGFAPERRQRRPKRRCGQRRTPNFWGREKLRETNRMLELLFRTGTETYWNHLKPASFFVPNRNRGWNHVKPAKKRQGSPVNFMSLGNQGKTVGFMMFHGPLDEDPKVHQPVNSEVHFVCPHFHDFHALIYTIPIYILTFCSEWFLFRCMHDPALPRHGIDRNKYSLPTQSRQSSYTGCPKTVVPTNPMILKRYIPTWKMP